jgi:hypothetical protein
MPNGDAKDPFLKNQAMALARGGIYFAAGIVVGRGWLSGESALTIVGAVIGLVGAGWTGVANTNSSIAQAFSQIPTTKYVETSDPDLASAMKQADPSTEVKVVKEKT